MLEGHLYLRHFPRFPLLLLTPKKQPPDFIAMIWVRSDSFLFKIIAEDRNEAVAYGGRME
jgi:hypothetical protein